MRELFEMMGARIKSPVLGYFSISVLVINWEPIYYLFASDFDAVTNIAYFNQHTSGWTLLYLPAIASSLLAVLYPWINLLFLWLVFFPTKYKNRLNASSEHDELLRKQELEDMRSEIVATREEELIRRGKSDSKLEEEIPDDKIKEKVKDDINKLRAKSDLDRAIENLSSSARELLGEASRDKNGNITVSKSIGHYDIITNGKQFILPKNKRSKAKWNAALFELESSGCVDDLGYRGETFEVTDLGYQVSDRL